MPFPTRISLVCFLGLVISTAGGLVVGDAVCDATTENQEESAPAPIKVARSSKSEKDASSSPIAVSNLAKKRPLAADPVKPQVFLSDEHRKTCRKLVGDQLDPIRVTDFEGKEHRFRDLLSDRFTVLILWNQKSVLATEQFRRIPVEVLGPFASYRVKVVAVNVGGDAEATRIQTGDAADKIVSLVDPESKLFAQLAHSRIPRTYVLDHEGRILWFDIEYSASTIRSLSNALTYHLKVDK